MSEEKKDLKKEEKTSTGNSQPEETKTEEKSKDEPTVEELQKQLADETAAKEKAESDRDNYKEGFLSSKAKKTSLDGEEEEEEEPAPKPKEEEKPEKEKTDTRQIVRQEINADNKKQIKQNEHIVIKKWIKVNPELGNDALRQEVIANYVNKNGKSVEGIQIDLNRAYNLYKIDNDIPIKSVEETREEAKKELNKNASFPTGKGGEPSNVTEYSDQQKQIMKEHDLTPKQWDVWVKAIKEGKTQVSDSVWAIINS